jgi:hypothetical protein
MLKELGERAANLLAQEFARSIVPSDLHSPSSDDFLETTCSKVHEVQVQVLVGCQKAAKVEFFARLKIACLQVTECKCHA